MELARLREVNEQALNKISKLFLPDDMQVEGARHDAQPVEKKQESILLEREVTRLCDVNSELVIQITNLNKQYELQKEFLESGGSLRFRGDSPPTTPLAR